METRASYVLVGAFVLGLIIAGVFFVMLVAGQEGPEKTVTYRIYFTGEVSGLKKGSPVLARGIPVGEVTFIDFVKDNSELVEVRIKVKDTTPVKTDTKATLQVNMLSGVASVQLKGGSRKAPRLEKKKGQEFAVVTGVPSQFEQIFARFQNAVVKIDEMLLTPENMQEIRKMLKLVNSTIVKTRATIGTIDETIKKIGATTNATVEKARATIETIDASIKKLTPSVHAAVEKARTAIGTIDNAVKKLEPAIKEIELAAKSIAGVGDQAKALLRENRRPIRDFSNSGLQEFTLFLIDSRKFVRTFRRLLVKLENDPSGFLFGNQQKGYRGR